MRLLLQPSNRKDQKIPVCFCESDAVSMAIQVRTRRRFPGIKFREDALRKLAKQLTNAVIRELPETVCPAGYCAETALA